MKQISATVLLLVLAGLLVSKVGQLEARVDRLDGLVGDISELLVHITRAIPGSHAGELPMSPAPGEVKKL